MHFYGGRLKMNSEIRKEARANLSGNWFVAILVCMIAWVFTEIFVQGPDIKHIWTLALSDPIRIFSEPRSASDGGTVNLGTFITIIIGGPIGFGTSMFFLNLIRKTNARTQDVFEGFKYFGKTFLLNLLMGIFVLLWSLLLIIPGIIASLSYAMAYYILIDNPHLSSLEAIASSKEMMDGQKGKLFSLYLSFAGWFILCLLTLGIGFIWLEPYMQTSIAAFYEDLKGASNDNLEHNGSEADYQVKSIEKNNDIRYE